MASQLALVVKNPLANTRDTDSIPGPGIFLGIGNGNPLQYSCLEDYMGRGAMAHGAAKRWRHLKKSSHLPQKLSKRKKCSEEIMQRWAQSYVNKCVLTELMVNKSMCYWNLGTKTN